jgi:hypothetical protein
MNYTDAATIKAAMGGTETGLDTLLDKFAGIASRWVDQIAAQTDDPACYNYFAQATVFETLTNAKIDQNGHLLIWPHKYSIQSVGSVAYTSNPQAGYVSVDMGSVVVQPHVIEVWQDLRNLRGLPLLTQISYVGGLGTDLTSLPPVIVDVTTVLAIRKFKEERSGMSDVVGVIELGTVTYTSGVPATVINDLQPFIRHVPWT